MKKILLMICCVMIAFSSSMAGTAKFGVGAFGGLNIPLVQDDQASGTVFGLAARMRVLPFMTAEPNATFGKWSQPDPIEDVEMPDGAKINSFGIDVLLGPSIGIVGFKPYGVVGAGSYKIKNDVGYDESNLGWSAGFGALIGLTPKFDLDIRGKFVAAPQDGDYTKKAVTVTVGAAFNLGAE
ncbi:MAG: porin family protein [Candidatus Zixiibacteriota bacterium]|nr:MAG: porin family protein [candidate division Zixibacteria bacterium]